MADQEPTVAALQRDLQMACEVGQELLQRNQQLQTAFDELELSRLSQQEELVALREQLQEQKRLTQEAIVLRRVSEKELGVARSNSQELEETVQKLKHQLRKSSDAEGEAGM
jgi:uncharacterized protein involved in exopolysaccharide biosynthesis